MPNLASFHLFTISVPFTWLPELLPRLFGPTKIQQDIPSVIGEYFLRNFWTKTRMSIIPNTRIKQSLQARLQSSQPKVEVVRRLSDISITRLYQQSESALPDLAAFSHESPGKLSPTQWENAFETSYLQQCSPISDETSTMSCQSYSSLSASELTEPTLYFFPQTIEEEDDFRLEEYFEGESASLA